jgi:hypothetical protein
VTVTTDTGSVLAPGERFEVRGGDSLQVQRATGPELAPVLEVAVATTAITAEPRRIVPIVFSVSRPARVQVELSRAGAVVKRSPEVSFEEGESTMAVRLTDDRERPLAPGPYAAVVEAYDGIDRVRSAPVAIAIPAPPPLPASAASRVAPIAVAAGAAALLGVGALVLLRAARRRATRT